MRLVKVLGVALVAVFAFSAMAAAGASAHEFTASNTPVKLEGKAIQTQVFTTLAGKLECTTIGVTGEATLKTSKTQRATVSYTGCVANNGKLTAKPDEPISAEYEFNAEGTVSILKPITILASFSGVKCTITVSAQNGLLLVAYNPVTAKRILLLPHVLKIDTSALGAGCTEVYNSVKTGTYTGYATTEAAGTGEIGWK
jgi:hypothetical protein